MIKPKFNGKKQFHGTSLGKKYDVFHLGYLLKVNKDNGALLDNITKTTVELEEKEATVVVSKKNEGSISYHRSK